MTARNKYQQRKSHIGSGPSDNRCVVYLDNDDLRAIKLTAAELDISRSHAIQLAIRAFCIVHHGRKVDP